MYPLSSAEACFMGERKQVIEKPTSFAYSFGYRPNFYSEKIGDGDISGCVTSRNNWGRSHFGRVTLAPLSSADGNFRFWHAIQCQNVWGRKKWEEIRGGVNCLNCLGDGVISGSGCSKPVLRPERSRHTQHNHDATFQAATNWTMNPWLRHGL